MSKPFDATSKDLLETDPAGWVTFLGYPISPTEASVIDADVSTVTSDADKVIRVEVPSPWLLHVELQASRDESLPWRLLHYNAILQHRHRLPVTSTAILLRAVANFPNLSDEWPVRTPIGPEWRFRYNVIRLWERSPKSILDGPLGLLPLTPLTDIRETDLPTVVDGMKERIKDSDRSMVAKVWSATYVLMGLRYDESVIDRVLEGVMQMEESVTYQAIIRRGQAKEARRLLLQSGRRKFGAPTADIEAAINAISDVDRLESLNSRLFDVGTWEELLSDK